MTKSINRKRISKRKKKKKAKMTKRESIDGKNDRNKK